MNITIENYIVGLGGRDVLPEDFRDIFDEIKATPGKRTKPKKDKNFSVIGVRG